MPSKNPKVANKSRANRTAISCDRCKARKTKCHKPDADGPCDYCRSINEICSIDISKRRQKPFYFVSEEEYRLLRELCSNCFPEEELTLPNLRRLASEQKNAPSHRAVSISTSINATTGESDDANTSTDLPAEKENILLPEIVNLHHDLGCLLADAQGEYRYMGAESGVSFNSAVRSWMMKIEVRTKNTDRDKIPPLVKVSSPAAKSPLTNLASPGHNPSELPPQDILSACAARFFEQVHCLYWVYSSEDFYTRLESTYSGDPEQQTGSWLCSLHSLVAFCVLCEPSLANEQHVDESLEIAKSLVSRVCDEADLDSVRALIVLALALQWNGFMNSAYLHIGLAARIAFSLGLHLDKYSTKDGVVAKAHARRLWWTLFLFDQDLSLQLGKPCMAGSSTAAAWQPPLPSECVVSPGSYTPHGYLEQSVRLAQLTKSIRQCLYDGPVHDGQRLTQTHFNDSMKSLKDWLRDVPPHLHLSISVSPLYRRSISLLHLRYWSAVMLVTKPFLLCSLLRGNELIETPKQPIFADFSRICVSAAESSFQILESMVLHSVVSSLVVADFFFTLQTIQVILAACELYNVEDYQDRARRCFKVLLAIAVSGYPRHLLPETLFQLQQCGLTEGADDGTLLAQFTEPHCLPEGSDEALRRTFVDYTTDQLPNSWLNEFNMADVTIGNEFLDSLMDISEIFPLGHHRQEVP